MAAARPPPPPASGALCVSPHGFPPPETHGGARVGINPTVFRVGTVLPVCAYLNVLGIGRIHMEVLGK
jgi:hypothetical protein